jgi:L-threonylcarbamoyladenylate synthase
MRIKIDSSDLKKIHLVGETVRNGGVIVYPTDTVLGIGGDPFRSNVVRRVFNIKQRDCKPMPVLVSGKTMAGELVNVDSLASLLMDLLWPGALTIVLKEKRQTPFELTLGSGKLGVRMPNHGLALKLVEASGGALIGTSANISGQPAARGLDELDARIESNVDIVVDGGSPGGGLSSTVIEVVPTTTTQGKSKRIIKVIREGAVRTYVIKDMLRESGIGEIEFEGI